MSLTDIKGIGPKTVEKLAEAKITTVEELAVTSKEELSKILGINLKAAGDLINAAKQLALDTAIEVYTAQEYAEYLKQTVKHISTGSSALDDLLGGGVPTTAITTIVGEYASGKTQLCYQLLVNCILEHNRQAVWIETESRTFVPERLKQIRSNTGKKLENLDNILVIPSKYCPTPQHQFLAYQKVRKLVEDKGIDLGILIVDSFNARFRSYYTGRETLPDRSKEMSRHMGYLDVLAADFNTAVVLTSQVMDVPDTSLQARARVKTGGTKLPVGGNVFLHSATYLIGLQKVAGDLWKAIIFDAPDVPFKDVEFRITEEGIKDATQVRVRK